MENVGRIAPELDAECIAMLMHYLDSVGITGARLMLNTRGAIADRKPAEEALRRVDATPGASACLWLESEILETRRFNEHRISVEEKKA